MRIPYKIDSNLSPQFDGNEGEKATILSFTLTLDNSHELELFLSNWKWGWRTVAAELINLRLWIDVLNKLDECLSFLINTFGDQLLVSMCTFQHVLDSQAKTLVPVHMTAERQKQCSDCLKLAQTILNWTSTMLERSIHKDTYNSIEVSQTVSYFSIYHIYK